MPELPEVETTRRGIAPHIANQTIQHVIVRNPDLRWPVQADLPEILAGQTINAINRRGKYLLLHTNKGALLIHLGMSGSLRMVSAQDEPKKHDHLDIVFTHKVILRFNDQRRFGAILWTQEAVDQHPLLVNLGPEPLTNDFSGEGLYRLSQNRKTPVKSFIMDSRVVVGVGNIYANEALFLAGIHPVRQAGQIALARYEKLAACIRQVLTDAIIQGGTTLRDFVNAQGKPGYFQQRLHVYGRTGLPCVHCTQALTEIRLNNRSTVFCRHCQH